MRDIHRLLERELERVPPPAYSTGEVYRRRDRRRRVRRVGAAVVAFTLFGGTLAGLWAAFGQQQPVPATPPSRTGETIRSEVNGVTIAHPANWPLYDPDGELYEFPHDTLLLLVEREPSVLGWVALDRLVRDRSCDVEWLPGMTLVVEEVLPDETGGFPPRSQSLGELPRSEWACVRVQWTEDERFFRATAAVGPNVAGREAILKAYASMRFEPLGPRLGSERVLAAGTVSGEPWELVAYRYQWESLALGVRREGDVAGEESVFMEVVPGVYPDAGGVADSLFPSDARADDEVVVFGVVPSTADWVGVEWGAGSWETAAIPLPGAIRLELKYKVFAIVVPRGPGYPRVHAAQGG